MRFIWTIGPLTIFDFTLFRVDVESSEEDVIVVRHYYEGEEEEGQQDGPDLFGSK
jgi:hypothetical protein